MATLTALPLKLKSVLQSVASRKPRKAFRLKIMGHLKSSLWDEDTAGFGSTLICWMVWLQLIVAFAWGRWPTAAPATCIDTCLRNTRSFSKVSSPARQQRDRYQVMIYTLLHVSVGKNSVECQDNDAEWKIALLVFHFDKCVYYVFCIRMQYRKNTKHHK